MVLQQYCSNVKDKIDFASISKFRTDKTDVQ